MPITRDFVCGMLVGVSIFASGLLLGAAGREGVMNEDSIRTKKLEIVDDDGVVQIVLQSADPGGTIRMNDRLGLATASLEITTTGAKFALNNIATGQAALEAASNESGAYLRTFNPQGHRIFETSMDDAGGKLTLANASGHDVLSLLASVRGPGALSLFDREGTALVSLFGDDHGSGAIETYSSSGERLIGLGSSPGGPGQMMTYNGKGRKLVHIGSGASEDGQIHTFDSEGGKLISIASRVNGPLLHLFNREGRPVITLETDDQESGEIGIWKADGSGRVWQP